MSPTSDAAVARALRLPLAENARVHAVHVAGPRTHPDDDDLLLERLRGHAARAQRPTPIAVSAHVARGEPAVEVELHARLTEAEVVVMGRPGDRASGDSTVATLLSFTDRPVLLVANTPDPLPYERALVAVDLRLVSADLLVLAARIVPPETSEVTVLHAFDVPLEGLAGFFGNELSAWGRRFRAEAESRLGEVMSSLPWSGVPWRSDVVHGDPVPAIATLAAERGAGLVVVGTHRQKAMFPNRVALRVLSGTTCDVLILPAPGQERAFPPRLSREHPSVQP
jgi:nucleotide-binding universal stress UspA family protein